MVLFMAQRGASVVRHLQFGKALSHPVRVAAIHTQAKRASPVTNGVVSRSIARNALPSGVRVGLLTNAYATAAGRPKTSANKTTRATKTVKKGTKTTRGTKAAKSSKGTKTARGKKKTTKKAKPAPKPKKKELTEKQKEQKDAKEKRDKLRELKAQALVPPKKLPDNYYVVGFQLKLGDAIKTGQKASEAFKSASTLTKAAGEEEKQVRCARSLSRILLTLVDRDIPKSLNPTRLPTEQITRTGSSLTLLYRSRRPTWPAKGSRSLLRRTSARSLMTDWSSFPRHLT